MPSSIQKDLLPDFSKPPFFSKQNNQKKEINSTSLFSVLFVGLTFIPGNPLYS
jgi:hypothetical protein